MAWEKTHTLYIRSNSFISDYVIIRPSTNNLTIYRNGGISSTESLDFDKYDYKIVCERINEYGVLVETNNGNKGLPAGDEHILSTEIEIYRITSIVSSYTSTVSFYRKVRNCKPDIIDSTLNNKIFYEQGPGLSINGFAKDTDSGNIVSIKYSINDGQAKTIRSFVSDGTSPIAYSKTLTYTNKTIKDGATTLVTGLTDGTTYNIKIWVEDDQGGKSTIVTRNFTVVTNRPPTISGTDSNLGDKNTAFNINYMVVDNDGDPVTVTEKLNGTVIRTVTNAPQNIDTSINISAETLYSLTLGVTNTIEIRAEDSKGSASYRRHTFKRSNTAPVISGLDTDLGEKTQEFSVTFSATDVEKTALYAKIFLNDTLKEEYALIDGQDYTHTISRNDFLQLDTTAHNIRIEVTDTDGGTAIRNFNFTKVATKLEHGIKIDTDAMSTQVLVTPTYYLAEGAALKVLVCNNANDTIPTWEDATEQVLLGRHYNFLNTTKTDIEASWGVGIKISIERGTATEKSYLSGYGGAYK